MNNSTLILKNEKIRILMYNYFTRTSLDLDPAERK